jgi:hypothetical protein
VTSSFLPHLAVVFPEQSAFNFNRLTTAVLRFIEVHLDSDQIDVDIPSLYDLHPHDTFFMVLDLITPCKLLGKLDYSASSFSASLLYQTTLKPAQITARVQALHPDVRMTRCEITDHQLRDVTGHAILSSREHPIQPLKAKLKADSGLSMGPLLRGVVTMADSTMAPVRRGMMALADQASAGQGQGQGRGIMASADQASTGQERDQARPGKHQVRPVEKIPLIVVEPPTPNTARRPLPVRKNLPTLPPFRQPLPQADRAPDILRQGIFARGEAFLRQ